MKIKTMMIGALIGLSGITVFGAIWVAILLSERAGMQAKLSGYYREVETLQSKVDKVEFSAAQLREAETVKESAIEEATRVAAMKAEALSAAAEMEEAKASIEAGGKSLKTQADDLQARINEFNDGVKKDTQNLGAWEAQLIQDAASLSSWSESLTDYRQQLIAEAQALGSARANQVAENNAAFARNAYANVMARQEATAAADYQQRMLAAQEQRAEEAGRLRTQLQLLDAQLRMSR